MADGIRLDSGFLDWQWFTDGNTLKLFLYLLLNANSEDRWYRGQIIKRGQLVTTLTLISKGANISIQTTRTCLQRLKECGELTDKSTNKNRVITICNYDRYQEPQSINQQANQQTTNRQLTGKQQASNRQVTGNQPATNQQTSTPADDVSSDDKINYAELRDFFNAEVDKAKSAMPRINGISEARKRYIQARYREFGYDALFKAITNAVQSDFLNGKNRRGYIANFDWIFKPTNFPKVLDGNYNNTNIHYGNGTPTYANRFPTKADADRAAAESLAQSTREYLNGSLPF